MDAWRCCVRRSSARVGWSARAGAKRLEADEAGRVRRRGGSGGGTDIFARAVQLAIQNNKLIDQPILVSNKGGGSGAETFVYVKAAAGDGQARLRDFEPLHAADGRQGGVQAYGFRTRGRDGVRRVRPLEQGDSPYNDYKSFTAAAKAASERHLQGWRAPCRKTPTRP